MDIILFSFLFIALSWRMPEHYPNIGTELGLLTPLPWLV